MRKVKKDLQEFMRHDLVVTFNKRCNPFVFCTVELIERFNMDQYLSLSLNK